VTGSYRHWIWIRQLWHNVFEQLITHLVQRAPFLKKCGLGTSGTEHLNYATTTSFNVLLILYLDRGHSWNPTLTFLRCDQKLEISTINKVYWTIKMKAVGNLVMAHCAFVEISCCSPQEVLTLETHQELSLFSLGQVWPYRLHKIQKDGVQTYWLSKHLVGMIGPPCGVLAPPYEELNCACRHTGVSTSLTAGHDGRWCPCSPEYCWRRSSPPGLTDSVSITSQLYSVMSWPWYKSALFDISVRSPKGWPLGFLLIPVIANIYGI